MLPIRVHETCPNTLYMVKMLRQATWIQMNFNSYLCKKGYHQLPKRGRLKAQVWFWIINETYGLILELSVKTRQDGPIQVVEQDRSDHDGDGHGDD